MGTVIKDCYQSRESKAAESKTVALSDMMQSLQDEAVSAVAEYRRAVALEGYKCDYLLKAQQIIKAQPKQFDDFNAE